MEQMVDIAKKYLSYGLNVLPVKKDKNPDIKEPTWGQYQKKFIIPNGQFSSAWGLALICGKISGNLECIDIDLKNDLTKTLYSDYKNLINECDGKLLKKLVVEKSPSGGYHFIYRCSEIGGNVKLAKRHSTEDELKLKKEKAKGIIETRGEGGYFVCSPSTGYTIQYGEFDKISEITPQERRILLDCAISFNTYAEPEYFAKEYKSDYSIEGNPFLDWDERGDINPILIEAGWKFIRQSGQRVFYLRPGSEHKWSANFHADKKRFYVFSDSTEFQSDKAYTNSTVLRKVKFNGDYSETAKWLFQNGYGKSNFTDKPQKKQVESKIKIDDDNFDFVATAEDTDGYIEQVRNGTFKMGLTTKFPKLDEHWRFKPANLVVINGHDNVGKSVLMWYFAVLSAMYHNWNWIIYSNENKTGGVKKKIIEFYGSKSIKMFSEDELTEAKKWFNDHFTIIKNTELFTYKDMIAIGKKLNEKKKYDAFLIDPYNSLWAETNDRHEYDYKAMTEFRQFITQTGCGIYLNCHAITEALRRKYPKDHPLMGYPMPPDKADTEGGGKFSNKADDFITLHRLVQHPQQWMFTEIHIKKIKEMETGGKHTFLEEPIKLRMIPGGYGFEDENGFNPITGKTYKQTKIETNDKPTRISSPKEKEEKDFNLPF